MASRLHDAKTLGARQNDGVMCPKRLKSAVLRLLRLLLIAGVIGTLAVPATRELHLLTARLLLRIPASRTFVQGQPPGCVIEIVPNVHFTKSHGAALLAKASTQPDAFIAAVHTVDRQLPTPSLESWGAFPHVDWLAFRSTVEVIYYARLAHFADASEAISSDALDLRAERAMLATHGAQRFAPTNGALWLCEAAVHFACAHDEEGLNALRIAAERPAWDSGDAAMFARATDLLIAEGLPRFDAAFAAYSASSHAGRRVTAYARDQLFRQMAEAASRNDASFTKLAELLRALQRPSRQTAWASPWLALPSMNDATGLLASMDQERTVDFADWEGTPYEVRQEARDRALQQFLFERVEPNLASELIEADAGLGLRDTMPCCSPLDLQAMMCSLTGMVALLLLGLVTASLMLECPFLLRRRPFIVEDACVQKLGWVTWVAVAIACPCVALLFFSVADSIAQPVGLQCRLVEPMLTQTQTNLLGSAAGAILLTTLRVAVQGRWDPHRCYRALVYFFGMAYVVAIIATAALRHSAMTQLMVDVSELA